MGPQQPARNWVIGIVKKFTGGPGGGSIDGTGSGFVVGSAAGSDPTGGPNSGPTDGTGSGFAVGRANSDVSVSPHRRGPPGGGPLVESGDSFDGGSVYQH